MDGTTNWSSGFLPAVYQGSAFRAAGVPVKTHGAAGKDHSTLNNDLGLPDDAFLQSELPVIDREKLRVMHDLDGYVAALDEIQARFVEEAKRRNVANGLV